jgi:hypothetical protein
MALSWKAVEIEESKVSGIEGFRPCRRRDSGKEAIDRHL